MEQRRVVDAGARLLADDEVITAPHELHRDLLHGRDPRAVADHHAEVHLLERIDVAPLGGRRHAVIARLDHARRAAHAEDPDVVARLVIATGLHERRRAQLGRELVGQRGQLVGCEPFPDPIVGLAPRPRRVQALERGVDRGHHRPLAIVAARLSLAVRATAHT